MVNHVLLLHFMVLFKYACPEELIIHFDTPYCEMQITRCLKDIFLNLSVDPSENTVE